MSYFFRLSHVIKDGRAGRDADGDGIYDEGKDSSSGRDAVEKVDLRAKEVAPLWDSAIILSIPGAIGDGSSPDPELDRFGVKRSSVISESKRLSQSAVDELSKLPVATRVSDTTLGKILKSGEFKFLGEKGVRSASAGGGSAAYKEARSDHESSAYGKSGGVVYGYLKGAGWERTEDYGDIELVFHDSLKQSSTFQQGDSLDDGAGNWRKNSFEDLSKQAKVYEGDPYQGTRRSSELPSIPSSFDNPKYYSAHAYFASDAAISTLVGSGGSKDSDSQAVDYIKGNGAYWEVQMHTRPKASDIAEVVFPNSEVTSRFSSKLEQMGIAYSVRELSKKDKDKEVWDTSWFDNVDYLEGFAPGLGSSNPKEKSRK